MSITDEKEGVTNDLETWLSKWKLSRYSEKLSEEGIESPQDFKYIKSNQDFEALMNKLGDIPFMHRQKFKDAWSSIVPIKQKDVQIHFLTDNDRKIMDKLYQRYSHISEDINIVQNANNEFNESVINAKKKVNDSLDKLISVINNKRQELLNNIIAIHDRNKKIYGDKLSILDKMSKLCLYNKEQFECVACDKNISSTDRLKKLNKLLSVNINEETDEKKQEVDNYNNYKIIGDKCVYPGQICVKINEDAVNDVINSFVSIECKQITTEWKLKKNYKDEIAIDWSKATKLNLQGGTGGKSGETKYVVNNIVVESSHPVFTNSNYYYIPYMFDGNTTTNQAWASMWLPNGPKDQILTFTFPTAIKLSHISAYSCTGTGCGTHKYGVDYFCDNKWEMLCTDIDTKDDKIGFERRHKVQKVVTKIRFNFEMIIYYISMSEIDFFVVE
eukprot:310622_1